MSAGSVFVDPGTDLALDRPSLSAAAPHTLDRLLALCSEWACEVGWTLAWDAAEADAVIVGPGVTAPAGPHVANVVQVRRAQGIDGFRWGIRSVAFAQKWPAEVVTYGLIADQVMDVRRPRRTRRGVAVLIHGGFWMQDWKRGLMAGLAVDLAERGWESWNIEYGRVGGSGGWPQTGQDVLAAIDKVLGLAETDEVTLIGHSAGGQLALHAGARRRGSISQVVSLAGLCDLDTAMEQRLGGGAVERLLDGQPAASASPLDDVPIGVPLLLAHCAHDSVVPVEQSERFAAAATDAGDAAELVVLDDGDHMSLIEPEGAWPQIAERL